MSEELVTIRLPRDRADMLNRVLDLQAACEESGMFVPADVEQIPEDRDQAVHGDRLPIQDGDAVLWPIACRAADLAQRRGDELPKCRWVNDPSSGLDGVACTRCGKAVSKGLARHGLIKSMVDGTYLPDLDGAPVAYVAAEDLRVNDIIIDGGTAIRVIGVHPYTSGGVGTGLPEKEGVSVRLPGGTADVPRGEPIQIVRSANEEAADPNRGRPPASTDVDQT